MLIDDIKPGSKKSEKLVVAPPPAQTLHVSSADEAWLHDDATSVASDISSDSQTITVDPQATSTDPPPDPTPKSKKSWTKKKLALVIGSVLVVLGAGGGVAALTVFKKDTQQSVASVTPTPAPTAAPTVKPTTEASRLSGVQIAPELNARHITGIMIENSPDARPQSGLLDAGVVYEAIAEGGITRFLALFQEGMPNYIGPVRSLRPYYIDWLMPYDATIAHVGGSLDALQQVKQLGLKDLDQFQNGGSYTRISERYAPHNVYTSMGSLDQLAASKNYNSSTFTNWPRKDESPAAQPTATQIDLDISSYLYNVHYEYNPGCNCYLRSEGGKAHIDEKSGKQLAPKAVIALAMPYSVVDASDGSRSAYQTVGEGPAYIFQDGTVTEAVWRKPDRKSRFTFLGPGEKEIAITAGQAWVSMVEAKNMVTYK